MHLRSYEVLEVLQQSQEIGMRLQKRYQFLKVGRGQLCFKQLLLLATWYNKPLINQSTKYSIWRKLLTFPFIYHVILNVMQSIKTFKNHIIKLSSNLGNQEGIKAKGEL